MFHKKEDPDHRRIRKLIDSKTSEHIIQYLIEIATNHEGKLIEFFALGERLFFANALAFKNHLLYLSKPLDFSEFNALSMVYHSAYIRSEDNLCYFYHGPTTTSASSTQYHEFKADKSIIKKIDKEFAALKDKKHGIILLTAIQSTFIDNAISYKRPTSAFDEQLSLLFENADLFELFNEKIKTLDSDQQTDIKDVWLQGKEMIEFFFSPIKSNPAWEIFWNNQIKSCASTAEIETLYSRISGAFCYRILLQWGEKSFSQSSSMDDNQKKLLPKIQMLTRICNGDSALELQEFCDKQLISTCEKIYTDITHSPYYRLSPNSSEIIKEKLWVPFEINEMKGNRVRSSSSPQTSLPRSNPTSPRHRHSSERPLTESAPTTTTTKKATASLPIVIHHQHASSPRSRVSTENNDGSPSSHRSSPINTTGSGSLSPKKIDSKNTSPQPSPRSPSSSIRDTQKLFSNSDASTIDKPKLDKKVSFEGSTQGAEIGLSKAPK
jgi:hypothetical protein